MPFLDDLSAELTNDPLVRGYAAMTDAQVVADGYLPLYDEWLPLTSSDIFEAIDAAEFAALTAANRARVDRILGLGIDIKTAPGSQARNELVSVFGSGSATIANLVAVARRQIGRFDQLGLPQVYEVDITDVRS